MNYPLTADWNPWFACAASMTARWFLPGLAWGWSLDTRPTATGSWRELILAFSRSLVAGLVTSLLLAWGLAETGVFTPAAEWGMLCLISLSGILVGLRFAPISINRHFIRSLAGLAIVFAGLVIIMCLPRRGEWMIGGWDPGVYVNQGVLVAREGAFHSAAEKCLQDLAPADLPLMGSRYGPEYWECFPGVPVDENLRSFRLYFFRMTPTLVATLCRAGGLRAACRVNDFAALLAATFFLAWVLRSTQRLSLALPAFCFLICQPIFLYHTHTPVSEMLELALLCMAGFLLAERRKNLPAVALLGFVLFIAMLNRISFMAMGGALLVMVAILDWQRADRTRVCCEHAWMVAWLLLGLLFDLETSGMIPRLRHVLPGLLWLLGASLSMTIVLDLAAGSARLRDQLARTLPMLLWAMPLVALCVAGGWAMTIGNTLGLAYTVGKLLPFFGFSLVMLAVVSGMIGLTHRPRCTDVAPELVGMLTCLVSAAVALTCQKWVAELYPWATKRFLSNAVPVLAIVAAVLPSMLWKAVGRLMALRFLAVILVVAVCLNMSKKAWSAWNLTEYDGISSVFASVAAEISPDEVVLADSAWWATPLTFVEGRQALDSSSLWDKTGHMRAGAEETLKHLAGPGGKVRFLTSAPDLAKILLPQGMSSPDWVSEPVILREVVHGPRINDYKLRERRFIFRLYTWRSHEEIR